MKQKKIVRTGRVLGMLCALCLMLCLCVPIAFADTTSSGEDYVVIGSLKAPENEISSNITMLGIGLIALGAVGIVCVIVWSVASGRKNKTQDEEIYQAVGMADARNKAAGRGAAGAGAQKNRLAEQRRPPQRPPQQRVNQGETGEIPMSRVNRGASHAQSAESSARRGYKPAAQSSAPQRRERITEFQDYYSMEQPRQRSAPPPAPRRQAPAPRAQAARKESRYNTEEIIREALDRQDR